MKYETLLRIADKFKFEVSFGKFAYWDNVLYLDDTAIVFVEHSGNSQNICTHADFPKFTTQEYIIQAVADGARYLGIINVDYKPFNGNKKYIGYKEL